MEKRGQQAEVRAGQHRDELLQWTSNIVTAYLNKNELDLRDLPQVLETVYAKLSVLGRVAAPPTSLVAVDSRIQAGTTESVPIDKSVTSDYIICLEDGVRLRTLKRYLFRKYRLTPEQYRLKWGLPPDYPMVAPNYAAKRSALAKEMGLGQRRKGQARGNMRRKSR